MKNKLLTFAGALALLAVLGKFYAPPLMAQVRAALVQDRDAEGRTGYQEYQFIHSLAAGLNTLTFKTVPAGKRLIVTHVNIDYNTLINAAALPAELRMHNTNLAWQFPTATFPGGRWIANADVKAFFDAGTAPDINVATYDYLNAANAVISGYMIDVP
jgi:hypothetical protein